jgi:hydrogenase maturation protein HypF
MALAALWAAGIEWDPALPPVRATTEGERAVLKRQLEVGINCVPTSSMGRLFDIVAALCGICQVATYEAQAAIELEALAAATPSAYAFAHPTASEPYFDARPLLQAVVTDIRNQLSPALIASRFHNAIANLVLQASKFAREQTGIRRVALTGGVFQNRVLVQRALKRLQQAGFETLTHRTVPPNDGGLALGQAIVAALKEK